MRTPGQIIKSRRKELKMTQKALALKVHVSSVTVGYWERDVNEPKGEHLLDLSKALRMRPDEIIGAKGRKKSDEDRQLDQLTEAFLRSNPSLQEAVLRVLGIVQESDKKPPGGPAGER